jgi:hypothetical protein
MSAGELNLGDRVDLNDGFSGRVVAISLSDDEVIVRDVTAKGKVRGAIWIPASRVVAVGRTGVSDA